MSTPLPSPAQKADQLLGATVLTSVYTQSSIMDVSGAREVTLLVDIDAGSTANTISIIPLMAAQGDLPGVDDDVWFAPAIYDGSVTAAVPDGTVATGADFTLSPEFGQITLYPTEIRFATSDAATDEYRIAVTLKCSWANWFYFQIADHDASGTKATATVWATTNS